MDAQTTPSDQNDELEFNKLISDIESGKIESWSKFVMYATLNGIDTSKNILVELFNRGKNHCVHDFLIATVTKTNSADKYITDEFLTTLICCKHDFRIKRDGQVLTMINAPVHWFLGMMKRNPLIVLRYLLSFEKSERQNLLDKLSHRELASLGHIMYCVRENCIRAFNRSKNRKFQEIVGRLDAIVKKLDAMSLYLR